MKSFRLPALSAAVLFTVLATRPVFADPDMPGTGANYETRLSGLEDEMREMNGRLERAEFAARRLEQNIQRLQVDIDSRLARLEGAAQTQPAPSMPVPQPQPAQPQSYNEAPPNMEPVGTLGALKMQNGRITGGDVNPQAPPLPETPPDYGLTPQEQYDAAFALLRQADYDGAEKSFKNFIEKNPKDKLIENAKYWYGETLYVRGKLNEAAVAFADAWQQDPQGVKAPDSLLKLGMSLAAINKTPDACTALGELKTKYPNASPTIRSRANEEWSKIKCAAR
ncbi:MAG: tol-pal system protein YbgF [Pseudomonadota bacterium]|nr:tol-pal system protein YbgF [Pseudomonadota bacterium]